MEWSEKVWGRTREIIYTPFYAKHELEVIAGGYCSLHYHEQRANRFHVQCAHIEVMLLYGPKVVRHMLGPDNVFDIPSLVPHLFCVHNSGTLVEEYYPDRRGSVQRNDIVRIVEGGRVNSCSFVDLPYVLMDEFRKQNDQDAS